MAPATPVRPLWQPDYTALVSFMGGRGCVGPARRPPTADPAAGRRVAAQRGGSARRPAPVHRAPVPSVDCGWPFRTGGCGSLAELGADPVGVGGVGVGGDS